MDAISEIRLALVHPTLAARVRALADSLEPPEIRVTAGIRSTAQQDELYAQGRTAPGEIVTDAQGTESNHVMGFAVDLVTMLPNGECDWEAQPWIEVAEKFLLRSGIAWHDKPHLELVEVPAKPTPEMQQTYVDGGVKAVWADFPIPQGSETA